MKNELDQIRDALNSYQTNTRPVYLCPPSPLSASTQAVEEVIWLDLLLAFHEYVDCIRCIETKLYN